MSKKILIIGEKRDAMVQLVESKGLGDSILEKMSKSSLESKGKSQGYLEGDKYVLTWAMGHMLTIEIPKRVEKGYDLFKPFKNKADYAMKKLKDAPFVVDNDPSRYDPKYQKDQYNFCKFKSKQYATIEKQLKRKDFLEIILAADADAEGERIGTDLIIENLTKIPHLKTMNITRFWNPGSFKSKEAVEKGMKERKSYKDPKFINLFYSARGRGKNDYIIGMKGTKLLSETFFRFLTVGRVQSPVLNQLYKREEEIKNFKPRPFWKVKGFLKDLDFSHFYYNEDVNDAGKPIKTKEYNYFDKDDVDKVVKECKDVKLVGKVVDFKKTKRSTSKPLLYSTNTFQVEFMTKYRATIEEADLVIEYLREEGFTTYPRTNGHFFSKADFTDVKNSYDNAHKIFAKHPYIMKHKSVKIETKNNIFNDAKASKQNHTPIVITDKTPSEKDFTKWESAFYKGKRLKNVKKGYFLIANRFMIQILPNDLIERQNLIININGNLFETIGEKPLEQGWRELTGELKKDTSFKSTLKKGDEIKLDKLDLIESMTKKPPMYTVPTLQKFMVNVNPALEEEILSIEDKVEKKKKKEEFKEIKKIFKEIEGIGTNATRKVIIMNLQSHKFIEIRGAKSEIKLTEQGRFLVEHLPTYLKDIVTTAKWEVELEKIRLGEITYDTFINEVDDFYINEILPEVLKQFEKEKSSLFKPSAKQISFAQSIAKTKGIELPKKCLDDKNEMKKWIETHYTKSTEPRSYTFSEKQKAIIERNGTEAIKKTISKPTLTKTDWNKVKKWLDGYFKKGFKSSSSSKGTSTQTFTHLSEKQKAIIERNGDASIKKIVTKKTLTKTDFTKCKKWLDDYFKSFKK